MKENQDNSDEDIEDLFIPKVKDEDEISDIETKQAKNINSNFLYASS